MLPIKIKKKKKKKKKDLGACLHSARVTVTQVLYLLCKHCSRTNEIPQKASEENLHFNNTKIHNFAVSNQIAMKLCTGVCNAIKVYFLQTSGP